METVPKTVEHTPGPTVQHIPKLGWQIIWNHESAAGWCSSMPDEKTALESAAAPDMLKALKDPIPESPNFTCFADELRATADTLEGIVPQHAIDIEHLRIKADQIDAAITLAEPE